MSVPDGKLIKSHRVPESLLRHFADRDGRVWIFDKSKKISSIGKRHPSAMMYERGAFAVRLRGKIDNSVERALGDYETELSEVLERLRIAARQRSDPNLSAHDVSLLKHTFAVQMKRSAEFVRGFWPKAEAIVDSVISDAIEKFPNISADLINDFQTSSYRKTIIENAHNRATLSPSDEIASAMALKGLALVAVPPGSQFIVGSNPVVRLFGSGTLQSFDAEIWLPISWDMALGITPAPGKLTVRWGCASTDVQYVNDKIAEQSDQIAAQDRQILVPYAKPVIRKMKRTKRTLRGVRK